MGRGGGREIPERLGRYEVLRHLASGGMADIYLARIRGFERFERLVVLKCILPELAGNPDVVAMFHDEARLAAVLHHANIVHVYDVGEDDGRAFMAMELLAGEDVRRVMKTVEARGRTVGYENAVAIVAGVCSALHHAHEQTGPDGALLGLVHRDVSPHNVFVTYDGSVKLVDFGIAKTTLAEWHTRSGGAKGKLTYMSPEQCRAEPLDRRSDIFSLSIMLWELTTGQRLFRRSTDVATLAALVEEDAPAPSKIVKGYPPDLEQIVMRGLSRNRDRRFGTAEEMQIALEHYARTARLPVSSVTLAAMMRDLFKKRLEEWKRAVRGQEVDDFLDRIADEAGDLTPVNDLVDPPHVSASKTPVDPDDGPDTFIVDPDEGTRTGLGRQRR